MINWRQTVISQYATSPRLTALLQAINSWIDPNNFYEDFWNDVWNIDTATEYGLQVWGRIVNIPQTLTLEDFQTFGFGEAGDRVGFGQGPFGDDSGALTLNFTLTPDVYRSLILAKAAFNITDGSIPAINSILMNILFPGRGNAYVTDGGNGIPESFGFGEAGDRVGFGLGPFGDDLPPRPNNMTLTYVFDFPLQPFEVAIVTSGVLPKPTGVQAFWSYIVAS
jgi:hypothetical protein